VREALTWEGAKYEIPLISGGPWQKYRAQDAVRVAALAVVQDALTEAGRKYAIQTQNVRKRVVR
jgi:hypothetical protein